MNAFFAAIAFLTRIPIPGMEINEKDWLRSSSYFPLVGMLIGFLLYMFVTVTEAFLPLFLQAVLLLAFWIFITGGLHLDGWMDVGDGLGSNQSREKTFEIMKDSRVGAIGVLFAIVLLQVKLASIYELLAYGKGVEFIIIPLLARLMLLCGIFYFPYKGSLGTGLKKYLTKIRLFTLIFISLTIALVVLSFQGFICILFAMLIGYLFTRYLNHRLGALNGDCYGAIVEFVEVVCLIGLVIGGNLS